METIFFANSLSALSFFFPKKTNETAYSGKKKDDAIIPSAVAFLLPPLYVISKWTGMIEIISVSRPFFHKAFFNMAGIWKK